jgi:hypothetical protein
MTAVAQRLESLSGTRHVSLVETSAGRPSLVTADLRSEAADPALATLTELGVAPEDVALVRLDTITPETGAGEGTALIWADLLGQARIQARGAARYFVLMSAAGVIAALAVLNDSATLIVGAMAISPDLLPVTAACTGIVLGRPRLVWRGIATLAAGLGTAGLFAVLVGILFDQLDILPKGLNLDEFTAAQTHVNASTILVAFAAGVAGMLAVLAANVAMMLLGGSIALGVQRRASHRYS